MSSTIYKDLNELQKCEMIFENYRATRSLTPYADFKDLE